MAEIKITLKPIDTSQRGSFRQQAKMKRAVAALNNLSDASGHDTLISIILENSEIEAPGLTTDEVREELMDYSADEIFGMVKVIAGADSVPPSNGA